MTVLPRPLAFRERGIRVCPRCAKPFFARNLDWHVRKAHGGKP